jgi:hypothetical protein
MASLNGNGSPDNVIIQLMVSVFLCLKVMAGYEDFEKKYKSPKAKMSRFHCTVELGYNELDGNVKMCS